MFDKIHRPGPPPKCVYHFTSHVNFFPCSRSVNVPIVYPPYNKNQEVFGADGVLLISLWQQNLRVFGRTEEKIFHRKGYGDLGENPGKKLLPYCLSIVPRSGCISES